MRIVLHIDHLVLDGLPLEAGQGARVSAAVERELARLLGSATGFAGPLARGGAVPRVAGPDIALGSAERPDAIGSKVAYSIHRTIGAHE
jgi:hypothetical protein